MLPPAVPVGRWLLTSVLRKEAKRDHEVQCWWSNMNKGGAKWDFLRDTYVEFSVKCHSNSKPLDDHPVFTKSDKS